MTSRVRNIKIHVMWNSTPYLFEVYPYEYRSLMALIYDKIYLENFGDCKGIGRCGTCHVHILSDHADLLKREGNETTTLNKMPVVATNSRLACQIIIDEAINGLYVEVLNNDDPGLY